jgi:pimeloyl-ACP methyl ester carboxylesterase
MYFECNIRTPRLALAGLSMGGGVALKIWRSAPHRITHLALLETTPYADAPRCADFDLRRSAMFRGGNLRRVFRESMKPRYIAHKHQGNMRLRRRILAMALVLCDREDALCLIEVHGAMASALPRANLRVLADCGHLSTMEEPAAVTAAFRRLLKRTA